MTVADGARRCATWLVVVLAGLALVVLPATPAAAHDVSGVGATNFRTTLGALTPAVPGVSLRVIENGSRLELRNDTATDVVVAGYSGEPYARIGPAGAFVNDNSPATYLNVDRYSLVAVPARADPTRPPVWRQVDAAPVLAWHDHRTHWMLTTLPPVVAADPGAEHRISAWTVRLTYGGQPLVATGTLDWVPGPSPWPWLLLVAALVAGLVAVTVLRRPHLVLAGAALLVVAGQIAHGIGIAFAIVGTRPQQLGAVFGSDAVLIWPFALLGAYLLVRGHARAIWLAGAAGLFTAVSLIVDDAPIWWRSSAPTGLPPTANRAILAVAVGAGLGLAAAVYPMLRRHAPAVRPWRAPGIVDAEPAAGSGGVSGSERVVTEPAGLGDAVAEGPAAVGSAAAVVSDADGGPQESTVDTVGVGAIGRRQVTGYLAAGAVGALAGATAGATLAPARTPASPAPTGPALSDVGSRVVAFHGPRQAGIADPPRPQARGWLAGFDLVPGARASDLIALLRRWTAAAAGLTAGSALGRADDAVVAGSGPAGLTVTVGFGPSLFGRAGIAASARPAALAPLPAFPGERLDPTGGDGDLGLVVAADDPMVVAHAARVLTRLAAGVAVVRWQQSGFNAARGTGPDAATPRNLMGQLDGTNNPRPADPDFARRVFVADDDPAVWLRGGSYVVIRRIRMLLDDWDQLTPAAQEQVIGRRRDTGAPLTGGSERTPADFGARTSAGQPVIAADAHMRLAAPAFNDGAAVLRRGFSFVDGEGSGLLFVAWQADPRHGFIPVQRRLVGVDALARFIRHETSALFAAPAGVGPGEYLGQRLLEG